MPNNNKDEDKDPCGRIACRSYPPPPTKTIPTPDQEIFYFTIHCLEGGSTKISQKRIIQREPECIRLGGWTGGVDRDGIS